ncbi:hypothetical protein EGT36_20585 [Agrobacterium sp. FDAARGOS_525]|uniref:pyocin knob domain-containing protein n=1 Tax=Agrobacterium sp. FDAARGOS_525 TaxID=2420311 RepID=UPI000F68736A|nr:pyocin knob domain-containing protein [Agrobacterium sp. FDAARGOS_525]RSC31090.1 hypothetical protein EGT36_20585 [Agrobacterium sp. FDAARGOS_525]
MAGEAYYNTGTATVAANSKTVTGTGTNWLSAVGGLTAIKAGDKFGIHVGRPIIIASVDSNTQLTLEDNWPGPAQTNAAYKIEVTNPDVIAVEAMRRLLGSLGSGVLYGLSQLPSTPSRLLGIDENGLAALLATIPNAQLPGRLRELSPAVTDADTVLANGSYAVLGTAANIPEALPGMLVVDVYSTTTAAIQYYVRASGTVPNIWYRVRAGGAWGAWVRIPNFGSDNIIPDGSLPSRLKETVPVITDDMDIDRPTGFYTANSPALNRPLGTNSVFIQIRHTANFQVQIAVHHTTSRTFIRNKISGTWQAWTRIDGDLSGPGAAVANNALVGFNGTSGYLTKALTTLEALGNLGPVFGGVAPEPAAAGVGMANGDFDTVTFPGIYTIAGSWTNGPNGAAASTYVGVLEVQARSFNNLYIQTLRVGANTWKRTAGSGPSWTAWARIEAEDTAASLALSALTPAADRLPYFNGASSAALATLTSFARTLLDDADAAAAWATLGAGQSLAANGWQRLPSGLILQWGSATSTGNVTVAFPTAFPNACYGAFPNVTQPQPSTTVMYSAWADNITLSNFALRTRYALNGGTVAADTMSACFWALGR